MGGFSCFPRWKAIPPRGISLFFKREGNNSPQEAMSMEGTTYLERTISERILHSAVNLILWPFETATKKCLDLLSRIDEDCFV
jgi:hypothetical protein